MVRTDGNGSMIEFTTEKAGKWDVQIGLALPRVILGMRAQGSSKWLRPKDHLKWKNALTDLERVRSDLAPFVKATRT